MARGSIIKRAGKLGISYCIRYRDLDGRQIWQTIGPNKRQAEQALVRVMAAIHQAKNRSTPRGIVPKALVPLLDQVKEYNAPLSWPPCVYFLMFKSEVIYIGQSINLPARLVSHKRSEKKFDRVLYLPIAEKGLDKTERQWIEELKPRLNLNGTGGARKYSPDPSLKKSILTIDSGNRLS